MNPGMVIGAALLAVAALHARGQERRAAREAAKLRHPAYRRDLRTAAMVAATYRSTAALMVSDNARSTAAEVTWLENLYDGKSFDADRQVQR